MSEYNQTDDDVPTLDDQHGDAGTVTRTVHEDAVAAQDEAEQHYAALACDDQGNDEWSAYAALRQVYERYGRSRMNAVVRDVDLAILAEHQRETARLAQRVIEALA